MTSAKIFFFSFRPRACIENSKLRRWIAMILLWSLIVGRVLSIIFTCTPGDGGRISGLELLSGKSVTSRMDFLYTVPTSSSPLRKAKWRSLGMNPRHAWYLNLRRRRLHRSYQLNYEETTTQSSAVWYKDFPGPFLGPFRHRLCDVDEASLFEPTPIGAATEHSVRIHGLIFNIWIWFGWTPVSKTKVPMLR